MPIISETPFQGVLFCSASEFIAARPPDEGRTPVEKQLHLNKPTVSLTAKRAPLLGQVSQNAFSYEVPLG